MNTRCTSKQDVLLFLKRIVVLANPLSLVDLVAEHHLLQWNWMLFEIKLFFLASRWKYINVWKFTCNCRKYLNPMYIVAIVWGWVLTPGCMIALIIMAPGWSKVKIAKDKKQGAPFKQVNKMAIDVNRCFRFLTLVPMTVKIVFGELRCSPTL